MDGRMDLAGIVAMLEDDGPAAGDLVIVMLRCPSGFIGEFINGRFLKVPCRGGRCRHGRKHHLDHVIDTWTGQIRTIEGGTRNTGVRGLMHAHTEG